MSKTSARRVLAEQRRARAIELRLSGYTYKQIAERLEVTPAAAHKMVKTAMERDRERTRKGVEMLREIERQRLERMILSLTPAALDGDISAAREIRQLSESLRKLLGLDAPAKSEETGTLIVRIVDETDDDGDD